MRTPLPPDTTLRDDPLRVLRAVRFASRYAFALDGELSKAMHDAEIKVGCWGITNVSRRLSIQSKH